VLAALIFISFLIMYTKISKVDKERLYQCKQSGGDYLQLADSLGIKRNTARAIVTAMQRRNGVAELQRGGYKPKKVDEEMLKKIEDIVEANTTITLKELNAQLRRELPSKPHIEKTALASALNGMLITIKKLETNPFERNSDRVKTIRKDYSDFFLQEGVLYERVIFLDESGYNLWTARTRGRSKIGLPATRVTQGQRGTNVSLLLAVSVIAGVEKYHFQTGSITKEIFQGFINELSNSLPVSQRCLFVLDNARCHSNVTLPNTNHHLKYLPPYTPQLNPIELCFSIWKSDVKNVLTATETQARLSNFQQAADAQVSMTTWRGQILKEIGQTSLTTITPHKVLRCYNHIMPFLYKAQHEEDF